MPPPVKEVLFLELIFIINKLYTDIKNKEYLHIRAYIFLSKINCFINWKDYFLHFLWNVKQIDPLKSID